MKKQKILNLAGAAYCLTGVIYLSGGSANAAGFEKSLLWSGREAGRGAAAVSRVTGSQSVFFNPAGLAMDPDASLNFSPTLVHLSGNLASSNKKEFSDQNFSPVGGVSVSQKITNDLGIGAAAYVAGGSKAIFDSIDLSGNAPAVTAFRPRIQTNLALFEYAIGLGYQIAPGFRVGGAWRIVRASGDLSTIKKTVTNTAFTYINLVEAKDTRYNGFRLGMEYQSPDDAWGLGATYRNGIDFTAKTSGAKNTGNVIVASSGTQSSAAVSDTTISTSLPAAFSIGGNYRVSEPLRLYLAADYVKYSRNQELIINGTLTSALLGGATSLPNIPLKWIDMWNIRFAGEYDAGPVVLRGGYVLTTRVTSKIDARATVAPPSVGHLFVVGAGTSFLDKKLDLDGAFEVGFNNGDGSMTATPTGATTKELLASTNTESSAYTLALHTGLTYRF